MSTYQWFCVADILRLFETVNIQWMVTLTDRGQNVSGVSHDLFRSRAQFPSVQLF